MRVRGRGIRREGKGSKDLLGATAFKVNNLDSR